MSSRESSFINQLSCMNEELLETLYEEELDKLSTMGKAPESKEHDINGQRRKINEINFIQAANSEYDNSILFQAENRHKEAKYLPILERVRALVEKRFPFK